MERPSNPKISARSADEAAGRQITIRTTEAYLASLTAKPLARQDVRDIIWTRKSLVSSGMKDSWRARSSSSALPIAAPCSTRRSFQSS
jgi:hypothetical protein